jgi:ribosomal protein S18 acetylase RimI-like enzyme
MNLRPVVTGDAPLLYEIYAATRTDELALTGWSEGQKSAFTRMQFALQTAHYDTHYPEARRWVVEVDGQPAGRLYVDRRPERIDVIDIALLPAFRGRGIGSALLRGVLDDADRSGQPVTIYVEENNPARRLYERMGFEELKTEGVYRQLVRKPRVAETAGAIGD